VKTSAKQRSFDWLTPERVERMWGAIAAHERAGRDPRRARRVTVLALSLALVAGFGVALSGRLRARHPGSTALSHAETGDVVVTEKKGTTLTLPDGSRLGLAETTELHVVDARPTQVLLELARGTVDCDVAPQGEGHFAVEAAGVVVEVKGTRFSVHVPDESPEAIDVRVDRGRVEVKARTGGAALAVLNAGQTWSLPISTPAGSDVAAVGPSSDAPPASVTTEPPTRVPTSFPSAAGRADSSPRGLFERANAERIAGRAAEAAVDYTLMRSRFPSDPRAGLAAFEAARIRLETENDPAAALADLRFALSHNRGGFAAEDAEALQVDALGRLGRRAECTSARDTFLRTHPGSAHTRLVSSACPNQ
jgi:hypothetical protein